jgi:predicted nucleic acid-binding protein
VIVLDTDVISELMRSAPAHRVLAWVSRQSPAALCTTSVTLAEVRYGIARMPLGRRRDLLRAAADDVFTDFADRVLPFDVVAAGHYADIVVEREHNGVPISGFDAQIAGICRARGAALATRNAEDFDRLDLDVTNPWAVAT